MSGLRDTIVTALNPWSKVAFVRSLRGAPHILDVGCGNDAVARIKDLVPDCHYTGIDIADYNQSPTSKALIDQYVIVPPEQFATGIAELGTRFDAVISSHNLEHVDDRPATLAAMLGAVKPGGRIYMCFPCEESVNFPSRGGTLNYFDDDTHKGTPPSFDAVVSTVQQHGFRIDFATRRYRPPVLRLVGLLSEPISRARNKVIRGTWPLYGFESIVSATRLAA